MSEPIPQSSTFAEDLARKILDEFTGVYYVSTEFQRIKIIKGAAQLIDCRMQEATHKLDTGTNPT
jgi:KaiC/GvpD/RAD55 family RecA-like ATPase